MRDNSNLHKAKDIKNDEFYTKYEDIEKELRYYPGVFAGKTVYCNFDHPDKSAFFKFFHMNFKNLGLKKLIATYYHPGFPANVTVYEGGDDLDMKSYQKYPIIGGGDFLSADCLSLLQEADIIVTNPAFSLFKDLIAILTVYEKDFLLIGNKNAVTGQFLFDLIKKNQVWLGHTNVSSFYQPDGSLKKFGNIGWFTNISLYSPREFLKLTKKYDPELYPTYENYDAINVDHVKDIPYDYDGIMGVPISFLEKYNPDQFVIIGMGLNSQVKELGIRPVGKSWVRLYQKQGGTAHITPNTHYLVYIQNGIAVSPYRRLLIKRK